MSILDRSYFSIRHLVALVIVGALSPGVEPLAAQRCIADRGVTEGVRRDAIHIMNRAEVLQADEPRRLGERTVIEVSDDLPAAGSRRLGHHGGVSAPAEQHERTGIVHATDLLSALVGDGGSYG